MTKASTGHRPTTIGRRWRTRSPLPGLWCGVTRAGIPTEMIEMPAEADVRCGAETIFDLIVDFSGQDRWLTKSSAFHGTEDISSNPIALGTT